MRSADESAAFASGLLIGHDVLGAGITPGEPVFVLADPHLSALYSSAITLAGGMPHTVDSHAAFVAGAMQIWSETQHHES